MSVVAGSTGLSSSAAAVGQLWTVDYRTKPNAPLNFFDGGQAMTQSGTAGNAGVFDGALVAPSYVTPGAYYVLPGDEAPVDRTALTWDHWDAIGTVPGASVAFGMFASTDISQPANSPAHMVYRDDGTWILQAFYNGTEIVLDYGTWPCAFNTPFTSEVRLDRDAGTVELDLIGETEPRVYQTPFVNARPWLAGFWEIVIADAGNRPPRIYVGESEEFPTPLPGDSLVSLVEFQVVTGRTVAADQKARVTSLLLAASEVMRRQVLRQHISRVENDTVTVRASLGEARLPESPADAPTAAAYAGFRYGASPTGAVYGWGWDGIDTLSGVGRGPVTVTYSHGYDIIPADIVLAVCQAVDRALGSGGEGDAPAPGVTEEAIDDYRYKLATPAGTVGFLADEVSGLRRAYGRRAGTIALRP